MTSIGLLGCGRWTINKTVSRPVRVSSKPQRRQESHLQEELLKVSSDGMTLAVSVINKVRGIALIQ